MRAATWTIRAAMAAAFAMIAAMAIRTAGNAGVHPDESLHFACFGFYRGHFWPPAVDHPGVERTFRETPMGFSYLSEYDVVYFVAGHATAPLRLLFGWELGAARAFQALLWLLLLAWIATVHLDLKFREIAALFGALAAFGIASFAGQAPAWRENGTRPVMLAAAAALGCFAAVSPSWRVWRRSGLRTPAKRLALLLALSVAVAMPRVAQDLWVNGGPARKATLLRESAEKFATSDFKPSVLERGGGWPTAAMAAKDVSLRRMLLEHRWFEISAYSSFGVYGYMSVWAGTPWLYRSAILLTLLTAGLAMRDLRRREPHRVVRLAMVFAGACGLILLSSILYSWVAGFQPQGRYLLPMFAMIGLLNGSANRRAWPLWMGFAASAVSFSTVGLAWAFR